jgi:hypothetical protein
MKPNVYLSQYSNEDAQNIVTSGSVSSSYDSSGNLLIDYFAKPASSSSISIPINVLFFSPTKVEEKYDTVIREFTVK